MEKTEFLNRLTQAIEYLKNNGKARKQEEIAELTGVAQPHVASALKGDPKRLTKGFLKKFAAAYADLINEEWLIEGKGQMEKPDKNTRPHIVSSSVAAGFMDAISKGEYNPELCRMIPWINNYDFTVEVSGDSMFPVLMDGDILACRRLTDRLNLPIGHICVFDTLGGAMVKELASVNHETVTLHSVNPRHHDFDVRHEDVISVALVVGYVRDVEHWQYPDFNDTY